MKTQIRGRRSIRESEEKTFSTSPTLNRKSRPRSAERSENDSDSDLELEISNRSPRPVKKVVVNNEITPETVVAQQIQVVTKCIENHNIRSKPGFINLILIVGVILLALAAIVLASGSVGYSNNNDEHKHCSFDQLQKKYSSQDKNLWKTLKIGVEGILNNVKPSPAVYLILNNGENSAKSLVNRIANTASKCFDPESKPIEINAKDFSSKEATEDYGVVVQIYKDKIKEGGVTIVTNLNEIPAETARALHAICDTYTPIASKAVIFLSLTSTINDKDKPHKIAEKTLLQLWSSKVGDHELDALITRVTDQVLQLNPF